MLDDEQQSLMETGWALAKALDRAAERGPKDHAEAIEALTETLSPKNAGAILSKLSLDVLSAAIDTLSPAQLERLARIVAACHHPSPPPNPGFPEGS